jgi:hypothetical protein
MFAAGKTAQNKTALRRGGCPCEGWVSNMTFNCYLGIGALTCECDDQGVLYLRRDCAAGFATCRSPAAAAGTIVSQAGEAQSQRLGQRAGS